jgi:hypothetical protein
MELCNGERLMQGLMVVALHSAHLTERYQKQKGAGKG